ncbi:MAG: hypothetical protein ABH857_03235 [Elusimicrobiota bacterium]
MIREILFFEPKNNGTDIKNALEYLNDVVKRKAVVFLISDFINEGYERMLRITNKRHDLISIILDDPRERDMPECGIVRLRDAETGHDLEIDTGDYYFKKVWHKKIEEVINSRNKLLRSSGIDSITITTDASYVEPLIKFFKLRERRLR